MAGFTKRRCDVSEEQKHLLDKAKETKHPHMNKEFAAYNVEAGGVHETCQGSCNPEGNRDCPGPCNKSNKRKIICILLTIVLLAVVIYGIIMIITITRNRRKDPCCTDATTCCPRHPMTPGGDCICPGQQVTTTGAEAANDYSQ